MLRRSDEAVDRNGDSAFERNCLVKDHGPPKAALRVLDKTISFEVLSAIAIDGPLRPYMIANRSCGSDMLPVTELRSI
jgi:hypothetical protein